MIFYPKKQGKMRSVTNGSHVEDPVADTTLNHSKYNFSTNLIT